MKKCCSFCFKNEEAVSLLIEKPGSIICNECVVAFSETLSKDQNAGEPTELHKDCTFCNFILGLPHWMQAPSPSRGRRLIRKEGVSICDDCLELCREILLEQKL